MYLKISIFPIDVGIRGKRCNWLRNLLYMSSHVGHEFLTIAVYGILRYKGLQRQSPCIYKIRFLQIFLSAEQSSCPPLTYMTSSQRPSPVDTARFYGYTVPYNDAIHSMASFDFVCIGAKKKNDDLRPTWRSEWDSFYTLRLSYSVMQLAQANNGASLST